MKNNSTIFKNPQNQHLFDLSCLGTVAHENKTIEINQQNHFFQVGDVLYYNIKTNMFAKAVAVNNIESEACCAVLEVIDKNNFIAIARGKIPTTRYTFEEGTLLYLSDGHPGKLVSIAPQFVIKQIATQTSDGIVLDIQRGYYNTTTITPSETLESYTHEELDEIIKNIW